MVGNLPWIIRGWLPDSIVREQLYCEQDAVQSRSIPVGLHPKQATCFYTSSKVQPWHVLIKEIK